MKRYYLFDDDGIPQGSFAQPQSFKTILLDEDDFNIFKAPRWNKIEKKLEEDQDRIDLLEKENLKLEEEKLIQKEMRKIAIENLGNKLKVITE